MDNLNYWENKWIEAGKDYILNSNSSMENIIVWDNSSITYDESVGNERIDEVIERLENLGYINEDSTVLDIGCGTGAYSIALSGVCKAVDALDFSEGMLNVLKEKIKVEGIDNINIIKRDWNRIDIEDEGMYKKYDFVICSLNPGCYSPSEFLKINKVSKSYCCYIGTDGKGKNNILDKADNNILGSKIEKEDISNVIYPFNILYSLGYRPEIFYTNCSWKNTFNEEQAINKLTKRYSKHIRLDNNINNKIRYFVKSNLVENKYIEEVKNNLGVITWDANNYCSK
ncbi:class I SAM-dependent methyltransferase [Romboutsia weinsteinii]|uniref:Class I SAM-dependent methyltransferase n=1 Tax=Romboutsia weinsteinii TaxID=2020949 RepID=A0A371J5E9_9FIRM|nr:class I SAM-dependent methyltransferase [Romboutsia weinsteinii]RDY27896.1 class I SAM-dependent methyltransferase [Romboutsia weinsteinii]